MFLGRRHPDLIKESVQTKSKRKVIQIPRKDQVLSDDKLKSYFREQHPESDKQNVYPEGEDFQLDSDEQIQATIENSQHQNEKQQLSYIEDDCFQIKQEDEPESTITTIEVKTRKILDWKQYFEKRQSQKVQQKSLGNIKFNPNQ